MFCLASLEVLKELVWTSMCASLCTHTVQARFVWNSNDLDQAEVGRSWRNWNLQLFLTVIFLWLNV